MITDQLLDTTLQAMLDSSWNNSTWELDFVLRETAFFTVADALVQAYKMFIFKLTQRIPNSKENSISEKEVAVPQNSQVSQDLKEFFIFTVV